MEDIKMTQKEKKEDGRITVGCCSFCGQMVTLDKPCNNIETAQVLANMLCNCKEAKIFQKKEMSKEKMKEKIKKSFSGKENLIRLLNEAVEAIAEYEIDKVDIKVNECIKATLDVNSDGLIRLTKTITKRERMV